MKYKRYPKYKDSGVEWLGEIPTCWDIKRIRFLSTVNPSKSELPAEARAMEVSFVPMEYIGEHGQLRLDEVRSMADVYQGFTYFRDGDVLVAKITPCFENGKGALARELMNGLAFGTTELHIVRPKQALDPKYLYFITASAPFRSIGELEMKGAAGQKRVPEDFVRGFSITVPPLDEQRLIALFLNRETAKIDALVAKKERLIELLQEKRSALITHAVTKGIDPNVPMKDSGVNWLEKIPRHWEVKPNSSLFEERDERGFPSLPLLNVSINSGVTIRELSTDHIEQKAEDPSTCKRARKGDIVFNKMRMWQGAVGVAPEDGLVSPDYTVARVRNGFMPRYFELLFRTPVYKTEVNKFSHGIVPDRNRLYWDGFKSIKTICPPREEQIRIIEWIDEKCNWLDALQLRIAKGVHHLREYRTALISAAVTGEIDVREEVA